MMGNQVSNLMFNAQSTGAVTSGRMEKVKQWGKKTDEEDEVKQHKRHHHNQKIHEEDEVTTHDIIII